MHWHTEHSFAPTRAAPSEAREFAATELANLLPSAKGPPLDDAVLILSELVTNPFRPAATPWSCPWNCSKTACIGVLDRAPGRPTLQPPSQIGARGRGLQIIETLSLQWGVRAVEDGKQVWAVIPYPLS